MKLIALFFILLTTYNAPAAEKWGSACGLTDAKDDSWIATKSLNVSMWSKNKIDKLPVLTQQQLIVAAQDLIQGFRQQALEDNIEKASDAVRALKENSESGDVVVVYYKVNRLSVTEVRFYPGGNPVGVIFKTGAKDIYAENGDDDIKCR